MLLTDIILMFLHLNLFVQICRIRVKRRVHLMAKTSQLSRQEESLWSNHYRVRVEFLHVKRNYTFLPRESEI